MGREVESGKEEIVEVEEEIEEGRAEARRLLNPCCY